MSQDEQRSKTEADRYTLVPRTVIFLRRAESYLLIKGASSKRLWPGKYNGVGGHIARGEDILTSAGRELMEETGLIADLWLCGTIIVDAGSIGVGLFVLTGEVAGGDLRASTEGEPEWIPFEQVHALPAVEDLVPILSRIHGMRRGDAPFAARSYYTDDGKLELRFSA